MPRKQSSWNLGALSPSKRGTVADYQLPAQNFPPPSRVCNSMMPAAEPGEITRLMSCPVRPGSDVRHPSRGIGC